MQTVHQRMLFNKINHIDNHISCTLKNKAIHISKIYPNFAIPCLHIHVFVTVAIFQRNDGGVPGLGVNTGRKPPGHAGPQVRPRLILLPGPPPSDEGQHR